MEQYLLSLFCLKLELLLDFFINIVKGINKVDRVVNVFSAFERDFTFFLVHTIVKFEKSFIVFFCDFFVPTTDYARGRTH